MALAYSGVQVELREVVLKHKPAELIAASAKATVPVLVLPDGPVLEESLSIIDWALSHNDPDEWLSSPADLSNHEWIAENDGAFKHWLDRYKYADRHPEKSAEWYRDQTDPHLSRLNEVLSQHPWLHGSRMGLSDVALFPFVRQFAMVDYSWFEESQYSSLRRWLETLLESPLFKSVMQKYPQWASGNDPVVLASLVSAPSVLAPRH